MRRWWLKVTGRLRHQPDVCHFLYLVELRAIAGAIHEAQMRVRA